MNHSTFLTESAIRRRDMEDPLAAFRSRFHIPTGITYLDGNSLGLLSTDAEDALLAALSDWRELGIGGWMTGHPRWFTLAESVGRQMAPLVGADPAEVVCTGTTTVNLHALLATFFLPDGRRNRILADELNFPSDIYALQGHLRLRGLDPARHLVLVPSDDGRTLDESRIMSMMTDEIALVLLPSVLYRSGQLLDMAALTRHARDRGLIIGYDCSHSAGSIPHNFDEWDVDFAIWCSYKYLNSGPGSPAFLYVNRRHFDRTPLFCGWFGYRKSQQFDMNLEFQPEPSAGGWQISTPGILGTAAVAGALGISREAGIQRIRKKSLALTDLFIQLVDHLLPEAVYPIRLGTPREAHRRGGHVALELGSVAWPVYQALKARGIVPDFRPPDVIRFAPVALYNSFHDIWHTVHSLKHILDEIEPDKAIGRHFKEDEIKL